MLPSKIVPLLINTIDCSPAGFLVVRVNNFVFSCVGCHYMIHIKIVNRALAYCDF